MKKIVLFLLLCCISLSFIPSVQAQLALKMEMSRKNYLKYEPVFAKVIMRNDSGHAIAFGHMKQLQGKLEFEITDSRRHTIQKINKDDYPIIGTIIRAGQTKQFIIPLSTYYNLKNPGKYRLHAYITHGMLKNSYRSNDCVFEISPGVVLWQRTVGIPKFMRKKQTGTIPTRTFLIKSLLEENHKTYFLQIEDEKRIYSVRRIGFELGQESFTCDVDMLSQIHILLPVSPKIFSYLVYDINGKLERREVYKRTKTIPTLIRDPQNGKVYVAGGEVARKKLDYRDFQE
jgi:hypothetical protein